LAELGPLWLRRPVEALVRLLAGIPSVVFGLIGLTVVVPWVQRTFVSDELMLRHSDVPLDGSGLGVAILVLTFMILPFFVTVATDSLRAVPSRYRDGGLALGLSPWRSVTRIVIPAATPGIVAGLVLAAARAIGEAIAISMVGGAIAFIPRIADGPVALLEPLRTMAAAIVENGETMNVEPIQAVLFALATLLLLASLGLSLFARVVFARLQRRMGVVSDRAI
jgi:phosphate transport system permease protein